MTADEKYMKEAIRQAKKASAIGEVPIGCVIVYEDKIIGRGYNRRTTDGMVLAHAEIAAIRKACRKMGDWRLEGCTLYVTLEPCPMCSGALLMSRLGRCVFGAADPESGCCGSIYDLPADPLLHGHTVWEQSDSGEECKELLNRFFSERRPEGGNE